MADTEAVPGHPIATATVSAVSPANAIPASRLPARIKVSPLARRLAGASGVDLAQLAGRGPGGRIVKADVSRAVRAAVSAPGTSDARSAPAPTVSRAVPDDIPAETVALCGMRKTIARRLTESKQSIPHIYLTLDIRLDPLLALRAELNRVLERRGVKLSVTDLLIKALASALTEVPDCNVAFAGDALVRYQRVDVAVAVAVPDGLTTPVIKGAERKSVAAIAAEMRDLVARARKGALRPDDDAGGTATLSNLGMFGIKQFGAILNPPQAVILAVGAAEKRPFVIDDALGIATVMSVTGSFDHRAIDGAVGARLMAAFRRHVENPLEALA